jgi:hypothetical protein
MRNGSTVSFDPIVAHYLKVKNMSIRNKLRSVEKFPLRAVTALDLFKINHRSFYEFNYNQSVKPEYLIYITRHIARIRNKMISPDTIIVIGKVLIHEHRAGVKCEPHVRTTIYFPQNYRIGFPLIDVNLDDFSKLLTGDTVQRHGYPKEHLFEGMPEVEDEFYRLLGVPDKELEKGFKSPEIRSASA